MKKAIFSMAALATMTMAGAQDISLPAPDFGQQSTSTIEALRTRHSVRSFSSEELTEQQLSNLCWAACGQSRDAQHITAPTAMNKQEIRLFVFTKNGVFEYDAKGNKLVSKAEGDQRSLIAGGKQFKQDFVMDCPVSLLMVIDFEKFGSQDSHAQMMGCVDAGIVSENINLYCQSVGLATVPRATHDTDGIKALLKLTDKQLPILNNPVGFEKK
ncbi:MAG: SagB/ThcOx family dehydrogenase [Bacteroidales bacterium]|nr:SagB/ThcOx family dehydrogenase [Bacteroidales bacterium]